MRLIAIALLGLAAGLFALTGPAGVALDNDHIEDAVTVLDTPITYSFDTSGYNASSDPDDPEVECGPAGPNFAQQSHTAWFTFVPLTSGQFRASTEGSEISTVLALWESSGDGQVGDAIACNSLSGAQTEPPPTYSEIPANPAGPGLALVAGQRYYLEVMSPQGAPGGNIVLSVSYSGLLSPRPVPVITALTPGGAPTGSGAIEVVISGSGLSEATSVTFGTANLVPTAVSSGSLTVMVPAALLEDEAEIAVTLSNPEPGGGTSQPVTFVVYPVPSVVAIEPTSVVAGSTAPTISVIGTGFREGISQATAGGVPRAMAVTGPTTAEITLLATDVAAPGPLAIAVTNVAGGGAPASSEPIVLLVRDPLDADCSGNVGIEDAQHLLRVEAGLAQALPGCPIAIEPGDVLAAVLNIRRMVAGLDPLP